VVQGRFLAVGDRQPLQHLLLLGHLQALGQVGDGRGAAQGLLELVRCPPDVQGLFLSGRGTCSRQLVSLDQPTDDASDLRLGDLMATPGAREEPEDLLALPGLVSALPELEREVIVLRFFQDLDQDTIAARVGFSQMHVSRLQRRALARMRAQLVEP
jgi:hypothetical protein